MREHPQYLRVAGYFTPPPPSETDTALEPRPEAEGQLELLQDVGTYEVVIDYAGNWTIRPVPPLTPQPAPPPEPPSARPQDPEPGQWRRPPTAADPPPGSPLDPHPKESGSRPDYLRHIPPPGRKRAPEGPPPLGPNPAAPGMDPLSPELTGNLVRKTARILDGMDRVMSQDGIATPEGLATAFHAGMQHLAAYQGDVTAGAETRALWAAPFESDPGGSRDGPLSS